MLVHIVLAGDSTGNILVIYKGYIGNKSDIRDSFLTLSSFQVGCKVSRNYIKQGLIFNPALGTVAPLTFSQVQLSSPLLCVNKYTGYMYTLCKGGGAYGVLGLRQVNTCHKDPLQVNSFRCQHFALPSMSLMFLQH